MGFFSDHYLVSGNKQRDHILNVEPEPMSCTVFPSAE
jgi:hypothetical protein